MRSGESRKICAARSAPASRGRFPGGPGPERFCRTSKDSSITSYYQQLCAVWPRQSSSLPAAGAFQLEKPKSGYGALPATMLSALPEETGFSHRAFVIPPLVKLQGFVRAPELTIHRHQHPKAPEWYAGITHFYYDGLNPCAFK